MRVLLRPWTALRQPLGTSIWLLQLRWFAVIGQLLTIAAASILYRVELPIVPLLTLVAFTGFSNFIFDLWLRHRELPVESEEPVPAERSPVDAVLMLVDLCTLTAMLYLTGGADNPFSFFFFVNLAVAGVILRPRWAWMLTGIAILEYGFLLSYHRPLPILQPLPAHEIFGVRYQGLWVGFSTCASVITLFVTRLAGELTERQRQLREAQHARDRAQRLEALTTLAAGAAHELATPLSTIAVVAREMHRHLDEAGAPPEVRNDVSLIDHELQHCRQILSRLRAAAGDHSAELWDHVSGGELIDAMLDGAREPNRIEVEVTDQAEHVALWLPLEAVAQALRNLVQNAVDSSPATSPVYLRAHVADHNFCVEVLDYGEGMSEEVIQRLGEPFFTTKEPGRGMGLGLFLTQNIISRLEGSLRFHSEPDQGTRAVVTLPLARERQQTAEV